ncbi:MAG TPA: hypothetical protein VJA22_02710, partial [Patescibacteria group bacterium]|nr:hypothetical protein [Patescibacteria group bacterium]
GESFEDTLLRNGLEQRDCYSEKEPVEQLIFMLCRVAEEKNFDAEWIKKASEKVSGMISDKQIYDFDLTLAPQEVRKLIPSELRDGSKLSILFKPAAQKLHEGGTDIPVFRGNIPVEKFSERARLTQVIDTHVMEDREGIPTTVLTVKDGVKSTATRYLRNAERLGLLLDPEKQERMVVLGVRDVYEASSENARSSLELIAFKDIAYMNVDNCTHPNNVMKDEDQDRFVQVDTDGTFGTHDSMINPFKGFSEEPFYTDLTQPFTGRELSGVKLSTQTRQAIEKFRENLDVIQDPQKLGLNPELQKTKEAIDRLAIQSAVPYDVYQWMREVADMFLSNGEVLSMHDVIQLMELKKQQDPTYRGYLKSADVNLYLRAVRPSSAIRNPFRSTDRRHAGGA